MDWFLSLSILTDGHLREARHFSEKDAETEKIMQTQIEEQRNSGIHRRQVSDPNFSDLSMILFLEELMKAPHLLDPFL